MSTSKNVSFTKEKSNVTARRSRLFYISIDYINSKLHLK